MSCGRGATSLLSRKYQPGSSLSHPVRSSRTCGSTGRFSSGRARNARPSESGPSSREKGPALFAPGPSSRGARIELRPLRDLAPLAEVPTPSLILPSGPLESNLRFRRTMLVRPGSPRSPSESGHTSRAKARRSSRRALQVGAPGLSCGRYATSLLSRKYQPGPPFRTSVRSSRTCGSTGRCSSGRARNARPSESGPS